MVVLTDYEARIGGWGSESQVWQYQKSGILDSGAKMNGRYW